MAVSPPVTSPTVTRFAPSPTGLLHCGHAYSALTAFRIAQKEGGRFLLRIEDIDSTRCQRRFEEALKEDLEWLGITWETPVRRQSDHLPDYKEVADRLRSRGLLYPCFCTRRDIQREIEAAGGAPHGSEGPLYPGTCRRLSDRDVEQRIARGDEYALRLNLEESVRAAGSDLEWFDRHKGLQKAQPELLGDTVLVRKDIGCSYHLCVVWDDALQGVNLVSRGEDLFEATHLHCLLQAVLGLPRPEYVHHELLRDSSGRRLAKRDQAETLRSLRERGVRPEDLLRTLGLPVPATG
ncbi:MAG: tRNA glutamyl-Q(34) synthetase GluQRS [Planctomycetaceae bacterium]